MDQNEPTIEVSRENGVLMSVKAIIPSWTKKMDDGSIQILLPHLGGATFFVDTEKEVEKTINNVFKAFCLIVEEGNGLEHELELIGWKLHKKHKVNQSLLNIQSHKPLDNFMLNTGQTRLLEVAI